MQTRPFPCLHSAAPIDLDSPTSAKATSTAVVAGGTPEGAVESLSLEDEAAKISSPIASPARSPPKSPLHPDPVQAERSPGRGSGTKDDDIVITGSGYCPVKKDHLAKTSGPKAKTPPATDPASSSRLPPLESMTMVELYDEYFTRLSQHNNLEGNLVTMMRKQHLVIFDFNFYYLAMLSSPQALRLKLAINLNAKKLLTCSPQVPG